MAELRISGAFLAALDEYVQDASRGARDAAVIGLDAYRESTRAQARRHPRWSEVADSIDYWEHEGQLHLGVNDPRHVVAAQNAEFGDEEHPPAPLLRVNPRASRDAAKAMDAHLHNVVGMR